MIALLMMAALAVPMPPAAQRDACAGCVWALDLCLDLAVAETVADLRNGVGWAAASADLRLRRAACADSYAQCKVTCQRSSQGTSYGSS